MSPASTKAESAAPAISVVMPVYNRAASVRVAIDSVLAQTFTHFELVVVDDGSTDGSAEAVAAIGDPRIRLVRLDSNHGANAARNEGLRQARARIVSFLDSDDLYLPHKLATVAATFAARPGLGGMVDSFRKLSPRKGVRTCRNPDLHDRHAILAALFDRRLWKSTSGISVDREAALRAGGFDEELHRRQDFDFLIRLIGSTDFVSISVITWVKTYNADGISAAPETYMPAFLEFWDRHPQYYADRDFRAGFAADLTRHYAMLLRHRRFDLLVRDINQVRRRIGWIGLFASFVLGSRELRRLRVHRRRIGQDWRQRPEEGKRPEAAGKRASHLRRQKDPEIA